MAMLRITRAGPLVTLQDAGRPGYLRAGLSAAGPMDAAAFERAGGWLGSAAATGLEFTTTGLDLIVDRGPLSLSWDGGHFSIKVDGEAKTWPGRAVLKEGSTVEIRPGEWGNYGYLRFDRQVDVPPVLGSRSTSSIAGLGGLHGRSLSAGDVLGFGEPTRGAPGAHPRPAGRGEGPIRVIWGIHAEVFRAETRHRFVAESFAVTSQLDRMGVRLSDTAGVFAGESILSLVSDAVVPGDIQILGDGTATVLMRDHQPTGGYPRIATIVTADFDRFAQIRPGESVRFQPVTVAVAQGARR